MVIDQSYFADIVDKSTAIFAYISTNQLNFVQVEHNVSLFM